MKKDKWTLARYKKECDKLWSLIVRHNDGKKCIVCGSESYIQAHHLISRRCISYRHDLLNGVSLCPDHHEYGLTLSAHTAPWAFEDYMQNNQPKKYQWWIEARKKIIIGVKIDYREVYNKLKLINETQYI